MTGAAHKPLAGVTVLDCSTFVTGGFCTLILAHLGADVIKIEPPGRGDPLRASGPPFRAGHSAYFLTVNSGKRSAAINLKHADGRALLLDLCATADVFVENFRPGTADRLGVGAEAVRARNPALVYCSISGFGQTGPWRDRPAYDQLIQGLSGLMAVTGEAGRPPVKVGVPISDLCAGMWGAVAVQAALLRRHRTGRGDAIDLAMFDGMLPWLTKQAGVWFADGAEPAPMGSADPVIAPYRAVQTADGWLNLALANDRMWQGFCAAVARPDLTADERFASNAGRVEHRGALDAILDELLATRTTDEWVALLAEEHHLPVGPVLGVGAALEHPQAQARGAVTTLNHPDVGPLQVPDLPLRFADAASGFDRPPPRLGEHTDEIAAAAGRSATEIAALRAAEAIA